MFDLSLPFIYNSLLAFAISTIVLLSIAGYTKNHKQYLISLAIFPFAIFIISHIFPKIVLQYALYPFYLTGLVLFALKRCRPICTEYLPLLKKQSLSLGKLEKFVGGFLLLYIAINWMRATVPGSLIDSMSYHMGAPKEWTLFSSGPSFNPSNPGTFLACYFEYFYYAIFLPFKPLMEYLRFLPTDGFEYFSMVMLMLGQYISSFFGIILIPFLILKLFAKQRLFSFFLILFILGLRDINWSWTSPKNEPLPLYYALLGWYCLKEYLPLFPRHKNIWFFSFAIIGIGLGVKLTNVYVLLPALLFLALINYKTILKYPRKDLVNTLLLIGLAWAITILPLLVRNYLETGNPIFPIPNPLFTTDYAAAPFLAECSRYSAGSNLTATINKLGVLYKSLPALSVFVLLSLVFATRSYALFFLALTFFLAKKTGDVGNWRYFPTLIFFLAIWAEEFFTAIQKSKFKKPILYTLAITTLAFSHFEIERVFKYPKKYLSKTTKEVILSEAPWKEFLPVYESNLKNYNRKNYVVDMYHGHYYSRFPFIDYEASNPKIRRKFYPNQIEAYSESYPLELR